MFVPVVQAVTANRWVSMNMADMVESWVLSFFEDWYSEPRKLRPQGPEEGTERVFATLIYSFSRSR